jgi:hypothetical protein
VIESMNEQGVIQQIGNFDAHDANTHLQRVHQMQNYLKALRSGEVHACKEWLNASPLTFPEDFTQEMNRLSSDLRRTENLLKQLDRMEGALKKQLEKLTKKGK